MLGYPHTCTLSAELSGLRTVACLGQEQGLDERRGSAHLRLFLGPLAPKIAGYGIVVVKTGRDLRSEKPGGAAATASIIHLSPRKLQGEEGGGHGDGGLGVLPRVGHGRIPTPSL